jgi:hypothetical protein
LIEILWKVENRGADQPLDRMRQAICRMSQRHDKDLEAALFEGKNFLSDEGLRKPRVPFENEGDTTAAAC